MKKILVTGTLFILPEQEKTLERAGFVVERYANDQPTEEELIQVIRGKTGYIIGGVERVTRNVLDAADGLRGIVHCGSAYRTFIPAWQYATKKGIAIANVPDGHTHAVAEWALAAALAMNRGLFNPMQTTPTPGIEEQTIGIIGLGHIGRRLAVMLQASQPKSIFYNSIHRHQEDEEALNLHYATVPELLRKADIVFLCVSGHVGADFFNFKQFAAMKTGALLVSFMVPGVVNKNELYEALQTGKIRAISDYPMDERFDSLPVSVWYSGTSSNAFNTTAGIRQTGDAAIQSLISILKKGDDAHIVNRDFMDNIKRRES